MADYKKIHITFEFKSRLGAFPPSVAGFVDLNGDRRANPGEKFNFVPDELKWEATYSARQNLWGCMCAFAAAAVVGTKYEVVARLDDANGRRVAFAEGEVKRGPQAASHDVVAVIVPLILWDPE